MRDTSKLVLLTAMADVSVSFVRANVTRKKYNLRCKHGVVYTLFYGRIRISRNLGNIDACADSGSLFSAYEREPGDEAKSIKISPV